MQSSGHPSGLPHESVIGGHTTIKIIKLRIIISIAISISIVIIIMIIMILMIVIILISVVERLAKNSEAHGSNTGTYPK